MKKKISILLSLVMAIILAITALPMTTSAANGVQSKFDLIKTVFPDGSYFTRSGGAHNMMDYSVCPADPQSASGMPYSTCECSMSQITRNTPGLYSPADVSKKLGLTRWQCCGFATYVFYNIFGYDFQSCGTVSFANAKLGDVVEFDWNQDGLVDHYAVFLYASGSNAVVYDANVDYCGKVRYGSSYSSGTIARIRRAPNYDSVYNSGSTNLNLTEVDVEQSTKFYIKSKVSGAKGSFLTIESNSTAEKAAAIVWNQREWDGQKWYFVKDGMGYKIHTLLCGNVLNPFSDNPVSGTQVNMYHFIGGDKTQHWKIKKSPDGYYVFCSVYDQSLVLTVDAQGTYVYVTTWAGLDSQKWSLEPCACTTHSYGSWVTTKNPTCTEAGHKYRTCSKCGAQEESAISATGHNYSEEFTTDLEPTYTSDGSKSRHCLNCDEKIDITAIPFIVYYADLDNNGALMSNDYSMLKLYVYCKLEFTDEQKKRADINHDGVVDAFDAIQLDCYLHGVCDINGNYI